jgi:ectoine hydroxylase-related dioxygenase (phytanoyl-CoA dioxygenase family)
MATEQVLHTGAIRDVTADEVARYRENGWVKLERLIDPDLAAEMLAAAKAVMGERPEVDDVDPERSQKSVYTSFKRGGKVFNANYWQDYHFIARDDQREPMRSVVFGGDLGRNAQRLMGRDVPVRYSSDILACKMPVGMPGSEATAWHQDIASLPFDRVGGLAFWVALNDIPPERGAMRFLSGSQREGCLGRTRVQGKGVNEYYPELYDRYELSPELTLRPGDATAHHAGVCHGAPVNSTDEPRWGYIVAYFPGDALYTGAPNHNFDGIGLEVNGPFDHPRFPQVHP